MKKLLLALALVCWSAHIFGQDTLITVPAQDTTFLWMMEDAAGEEVAVFFDLKTTGALLGYTLPSVLTTEKGRLRALVWFQPDQDSVTITLSRDAIGGKYRMAIEADGKAQDALPFGTQEDKVHPRYWGLGLELGKTVPGWDTGVFLRNASHNPGRAAWETVARGRFIDRSDPMLIGSLGVRSVFRFHELPLSGSLGILGNATQTNGWHVWPSVQSGLYYQPSFLELGGWRLGVVWDIPLGGPAAVKPWVDLSVAGYL